MLEQLKAFRTVALVSGIGAAGLLAYRCDVALQQHKMYTAYGGSSTSSSESAAWGIWWIPQSFSFSPSSWLQHFATLRLIDPSTADPLAEARGTETELLERHFDMTVRAADDYHSEMLNSIAEKIFQVDGMEELIRNVTEAEGANQEEHLNQLKAVSLTRFVVALWTVPTTFLLCRLLFSIFGRIVFLCKAAESIHRNSRKVDLETEPCPPLFGISNQRQLLRTFKSIMPDTISRVLYRLIHQVVMKHVQNMKCDSVTSLQSMKLLLSKINGEIESKFAAENGTIWKSLFGDPAVFLSLGIGQRDDDLDEQTAFIEDVLREARRTVQTRAWHVVVVDAVKVFTRTQMPFMLEAYTTVMHQMRQPPCAYEDNEASSEVSASGDEDATVVHTEEAESETSDKSAYDVSHSSSVYYVPGRDLSRYSPETRLPPTQDRTRLVAEDGVEAKGEDWGGCNESEMDTGEHHSVDQGISPQPRNRAVPQARQPVGHDNQTPLRPEPPVEGIHFFRWATKLGRRGEDLLTENADVAVQDLSRLPIVHDFCLDVFAADSVTCLPRCQLESAPVIQGRH